MKFYIDTSVFGGVFDDEFEEDTAAFFEIDIRTPRSVLPYESRKKKCTHTPDPSTDSLAAS